MVSQPYTAAPKLRSPLEELSATLLSTHSMFEDRPHKRRIIAANDGSVSATWLDVYPPTETTEESSSPSPPASPVPNTKRLIRTNKMKDVLSTEIKSNIEIREHFLRLKKYGREECFFCSATNNTSANCGPTCARLRPQINSSVAHSIDALWRAEADLSVKKYHRILEEIEDKGTRARNSQLLKWGKAIQGLKRDTLNRSEVKDKTGWPNKNDYSKAKKAGVDIKWTFESAWGTSLPPDEEVAPDEDVR